MNLEVWLKGQQQYKPLLLSVVIKNKQTFFQSQIWNNLLVVIKKNLIWESSMKYLKQFHKYKLISFTHYKKQKSISLIW